MKSGKLRSKIIIEQNKRKKIKLCQKENVCEEFYFEICLGVDKKKNLPSFQVNQLLSFDGDAVNRMIL